MRGVAFLLLAALVLTGCAETPEQGPLASGGMHVLVVGGTVVESGPEPQGGAICDLAAPPFSADDDERRIWYVPESWHEDDPREADLVVVRVDRTEQVWDDGCWSYQLQAHGSEGEVVWYHPDVPRSLPVRLEEGGVRVGNALLEPGDETTWRIDASCFCDPSGGGRGAYQYEGTLHVVYLGDWGDDGVTVTDYQGLPPLDVPYWDGWG